MKEIDDFLNNKVTVTTTPNSERAYLIGEILERTNPSRVEGGYQPWTAQIVAVKLAKFSTAELRDMFYASEKQRNFSKTFWGKVKFCTALLNKKRN